MYHNPVLLEQSVAGLSVDPAGTYVDVTFGGGGHSRRILELLGPSGRLVAFDQDPDAAANVPADDRVTFVAANFRHLKRFLQYHNAYPADGILADLGVSSHQFDTANRGFSHRMEGELDMRMNSDRGVTAAQVVNTYPAERLADIFFRYGELSDARQLAALIVRRREENGIRTTTELADAMSPLLPRGKENKVLAQIFQALRIEVNDEMGALREFLSQTADALKPGGRLSVISYHSLEDRLVKNYMRAGNFEGTVEKDFFGQPLCPFTPVNRKPLLPDEQELADNPRARSAKLRIAQRNAFPNPR
ncbi:MAG: 16S rRNA (cytosine(1402)-N(4))-methyltransferase RsmH [Bacteroidales bacterium]|nr:16S rRNA (cytosine(1402)-N(4))-methyltransferase RsmH [Bacteroidales bacterium]